MVLGRDLRAVADSEPVEQGLIVGLHLGRYALTVREIREDLQHQVRLLVQHGREIAALEQPDHELALALGVVSPSSASSPNASTGGGSSMASAPADSPVGCGQLRGPRRLAQLGVGCSLPPQLAATAADAEKVGLVAAAQRRCCRRSSSRPSAKACGDAPALLATRGRGSSAKTYWRKRLLDRIAEGLLDSAGHGPLSDAILDQAAADVASGKLNPYDFARDILATITSGGKA